jgi:rod shape-determining protein MreD
VLTLLYRLPAWQLVLVGYGAGLLQDVIGHGALGVHALGLAGAALVATTVRAQLSQQGFLERSLAVFAAVAGKWAVIAVLLVWLSGGPARWRGAAVAALDVAFTVVGGDGCCSRGASRSWRGLAAATGAAVRRGAAGARRRQRWAPRRRPEPARVRPRFIGRNAPKEFVPGSASPRRTPRRPILPRVRVLLALLLSVMVVFTGRLMYLQIAMAEEYRERSEQNFTQERRITPLRGRILARDGTVLADNRVAYDLMYWGGDIDGWDRLQAFLGLEGTSRDRPTRPASRSA